MGLPNQNQNENGVNKTNVAVKNPGFGGIRIKNVLFDQINF